MATARRTLGDALAMTPDKLAFIQGPNVAEEEKPSRTNEVTKSVPPIEEATNSTVTQEAERTESQIERPSRSQKKQSRSRELDQSEFNDEALLSLASLLVPLTTRLQPRTAAALKRAGLEQKLRGRSPSTVQEIAEEAIQKWLQSVGYL